MRTNLALFLVAITLSGLGAFAQPPVSTAPVQGPVMTAPGQHRQQPPGGRSAFPGILEGYVYWDTSGVQHNPPLSCSGLAVTVSVGTPPTGSTPTFEQFQPIGTFNNFTYLNNGSTLGVCAYAVEHVPTGQDLRVQISTTPSAFSTAVSPVTPPTANDPNGPIKIVGGQCSNLPPAVPSPSVLGSGWWTCGNYAYNVNFVLRASGANPSIGGSGQSALSGAQKPLTNPDVIRMVKAGVPESAIVTSIQSSPAKFDLSPDGLLALHRAGVGQKILDTMMTSGTSQPMGANPGNSQPSPPHGTVSATGSGATLQPTPLPGVQSHKLPPIRSSPKRDASPPADETTKASIKSKLDAQVAAFKKKMPVVASVHTPAAGKSVPETQALERQKASIAQAKVTQSAASPMMLGSASKAAPSTGAVATTTATPMLATTPSEPAMKQAPSSSAPHQSTSTPPAIATTPILATAPSEPAMKQAPTSSVPRPTFNGPNPNEVVQPPAARMCLTAQIYNVNNATSGVVFTQDPAYNDYLINGCGFGNQGGQVYLSGAVTNGRINMVVKQWSPGQIEVEVQPGLRGVLDGWPDLIVIPAGNPPVKFPNCRFYTQRQSVSLSTISLNAARLANVQVGEIDYCPVGSQLGACTYWYSGGPLSSVANGVDRNSALTGSSFNPGQDLYDLSQMTPGFVIDGFGTFWYGDSATMCKIWSQQAKVGDSFDYSTQGYYGSALKGDSQIVVDWGVDHCAWHWMGIFDVSDFYGAGYSLSVSVKGPIGVDPWTGKPD